MFYYLKFFLKFSPLIIFFLLEYYIFNPTINIYYLFFVVILLAVSPVWLMDIRGDLSLRRSVFLIFPVLFEISFFLFLVMENISFQLHYLLLANSLALYFYFRTLRLYFSGIDKGSALNNISVFGNFILMFFISASVYGLQSYLRVSVWVLMVFFIISLALVVYSVMYINKIKTGTSLFYILLLCLVMLELAWSIYFLPVSYKISGFVLAVCYYMLMGLSRHHLQETLKPRITKLYLSFGFASIVLVLLTSRWI